MCYLKSNDYIFNFRACFISNCNSVSMDKDNFNVDKLINVKETYCNNIKNSLQTQHS